MALKAGIVGLPNVGKSTLFNAITKKNILAANYPFATIDPNVGVVTVPDKRVEYLENLYIGSFLIASISKVPSLNWQNIIWYISSVNFTSSEKYIPLNTKVLDDEVQYFTSFWYSNSSLYIPSIFLKKHGTLTVSPSTLNPLLNLQGSFQ